MSYWEDYSLTGTLIEETNFDEVLRGERRPLSSCTPNTITSKVSGEVEVENGKR